MFAPYLFLLGAVIVIAQQCNNNNQDAGELLQTFIGHKAHVYQTAILSNGDFFSCSQDKTLIKWNARTGGVELLLTGHKSIVKSVVNLKNGFIASGSWDGTVKIWDEITGALNNSFIVTCDNCGICVNNLALLPNGSLATGSDNNVIQIWEPMTGKLLSTFSGFSYILGSLVVWPDGSKIAGGVQAGGNFEIRVFDLNTGLQVAALFKHTSDVLSLILISNDTILVSSSLDKSIIFWNITDWSVIRKLETNEQVFSLLYLLDGTVAFGGANMKITILDPYNGYIIRTFQAHTDVIWGLSLRLDGSFISASSDKSLRLWSPNAGYLLRTLTGHTDGITQIASLGSNVPHSFVSASLDMNIIVWDYLSGGLIRTLAGHKDSVNSVVVMNDDSVCSAGNDMKIIHWDPMKTEKVRLIDFKYYDTVSIRSLIMLSDGSLVSGAISTLWRDGIVSRWNISNTESDLSEWWLAIPSDTSTSGLGIYDVIALENDVVVTAHGNGNIGFWDPYNFLPQTPLQMIQYFTGHSNTVWIVIVLENDVIVTGSLDQTVIIWNTETGLPNVILKGHTNSVYGLVDLKNGYFASGACDGKIMIWSYEGVLNNTITSIDQSIHPGLCINSLGLLPNGTVLAGTDLANIQLWNPFTGELLGLLTGFSNSVTIIVVNAEGNLIIGGTQNGNNDILVFDSLTGCKIASLYNQTSAIYQLTFIQNETFLLSGSLDSSIVWWNVSSWISTNYVIVSFSIYTMLDLLDGNFICGGGNSNFIFNYNGNFITEFFTASINSMALRKDGSIVGGSFDNFVKIWSPNGGEYSGKWIITNNMTPMNVLLAVPSFNYLISGSDDNNIYIWSLIDKSLITILSTHSSSVYGLTLFTDGLTLVSTAGDGTIKFHDLSTFEITRVYTGTGSITSPLFLSSGNLVTGNKAGSIDMWIIACSDGGAFCMPNSDLPILCSFAGYYCPPTNKNSGIIKPVDCPPGAFCPGFSTVPTNCTAGTYSALTNNQDGCQDCPMTAFCASGSIEALPCPDGYFCSDPSVKTKCTNGYVCPPGTVKLDNQLCNEGFFCDGSGNLRNCSAGFYCPQGTPLEKICSLKSYCPEGTAIQSYCPLGFFCSSPSNISQCRPGTFCDLGSIQESPCSLGYYCPDGKTFGKCDAGFYCPTPSEKYVCYPGEYCDVGSTINSLCDSGYYCDDGIKEVKCEIGSYCAPGSISEKRCPIGFYCPKPNNLYPCSKIGTYCAVGSTEEGYCEAGFYCQNSTIIQPCEKGYTCIKGSGSQTPCPLGTYNSEIQSVDTAKCLNCPLTYTTLNIASQSILDCVCDVNYYAMHQGNTSSVCISCMNGLLCNLPGLNSSSVKVEVGFFPIRVGDSINVLPCAYGACTNSSGSNFCAHGYEGFLCSSCSYSFYKSSNECLTCGQDNIWNAGKVLKSDELMRNGTVPLVNEAAQGGNINFSVIQRLVLSHLQIIALLTKLQLKWPPIIQNLYQVSGSISSVSFVSGDLSFGGGIKCLLYLPQLPTTVNELLVSFLTIIFGIVLVTIFWYARKYVSSRGRRVTVVLLNETGSRVTTHQKIVITIVAIVYLSYSSILRVFFQMFSCVSYSYDNKLRLQGDLDIICFSSLHLKWLSLVALPVFISVIFGAPMIGFLKLYKEHKVGHLHSNINLVASYGFLFDGYKQAFWYWELVTLGRKIMLNAVCVFLSLESSVFYQAAVAQGILVVAFVIQQEYKPYRDDRLNRLEGIGLLIGIVSLFLVSISPILENSEWIITILVIAINVFWYLYLFKLVLFPTFRTVGRAFTRSRQSSNMPLTTEMTNNDSSRVTVTRDT